MQPLSREQYLKTDVLSWVGTALCSCAFLLVLFNHKHFLQDLAAPYRVTVPSLCLLFAALISARSPRAGVVACLFALPLLPNFSTQLQAFTGYGRVAPAHLAGWDLVTGLAIGVLINNWFQKTWAKISFKMPWPIALMMVYLSFSVALAIARNLFQTDALFHWAALGNNLLNLRALSLHDDYTPLIDWVSFGCALVFFTIVFAVLKDQPKRNHLVFIPLLVGLVVSALVGLEQSQSGRGLQWDHLSFRVDILGFVALGFQPDIHAYAGQMLIGALGLLGYVGSLKPSWYRWGIIALIIPLSWLGLVLSKSKASIAVGLVMLLTLAVVWRYRHSSYFKNIVIAAVALCALVLFCVAIAPNHTIAAFNYSANLLGFTDLQALNLKLSYRPEVLLAAIKMSWLLPLFGLGQSEFFRQSANYELTNSYFLSVQQNGENAHNYFLQTLAETGLIGALVFGFALLYPFLRQSQLRVLLPASVALLAVVSGNVFAHALLVRENLFVAVAFIALLYAWLPNTKLNATFEAAVDAPGVALQSWVHHHRLFVAGLFCLVTSLGVKEVYQSFSRFPFTFDTQCFRPRELTKDGWTGGMLELPLPTGARSITLNVAGDLPDIVRHPLAATLSIVRGANEVLVSTPFTFNSSAPSVLSVTLGDSIPADRSDYRAILKLQRCFVPRNLGNTLDDRRLGVRITSVGMR